MIIKEKYILVDNSGKIKTTLNAKLRFSKEVAPIIRKNIINRICGKVYGKNQEPGMLSEYPLNDYLSKVEQITYNPLNGKYQDNNPIKKRKINITKRPWRLGIDIKVSSLACLKSKDLLNLGNLHNFILNEEYPKGDRKI